MVLEVHGAVVADKDVNVLRNAIQEIVERGEHNLLIDLHETHRMNSSAIGVLVGAHTSYARRGWHLRFCGITKEVHLLLSVTDLRRVFQIDETREGAIHMFEGAGIRLKGHPEHRGGGGGE
jgi:anti-anti-sigma factor